MKKLLISVIGLFLLVGLEGKSTSAPAQPYERAIERANHQAEQYREAQLARPAQMRAVLASQAYGRRLLRAEAAAEEENQRRQTALEEAAIAQRERQEVSLP